jgi:hypothetical protein
MHRNPLDQLTAIDDRKTLHVNSGERRKSIARDAKALSDAEALLSMYPEVTDAELDRIARFLRHGAPIDIGLLSSNASLWEVAERFKNDHPRYFRLRPQVYLWWLLALAALVLCLVNVKDIGLSRASVEALGAVSG